MIESEVSKQYLLEEDAVEGFRQAVNNGQVRLALQILVDIVDVFESFISSFVEEEDEEKVTEEIQHNVVESKVVEKEEAKEDSAPAYDAAEEKKPATKKSVSKTEEATKVTA